MFSGGIEKQHRAVMGEGPPVLIGYCCENFPSRTAQWSVLPKIEEINLKT